MNNEVIFFGNLRLSRAFKALAEANNYISNYTKLRNHRNLEIIEDNKLHKVVVTLDPIELEFANELKNEGFYPDTV